MSRNCHAGIAGQTLGTALGQYQALLIIEFYGGQQTVRSNSLLSDLGRDS